MRTTMDKANYRNWSTGTTAFFLIINILLAYLCLHYISSYFIKSSVSDNTASQEIDTSISEIDVHKSDLENDNLNVTIKKRIIKLQPSCPKNYIQTILYEILNDLYINKEMCKPEDVNNLKKHRIPKIASKTNKSTEPRGTMVVYIAVGLLLTSLGAAILELYKAKGQTSVKTKPALTRKCSLADLTVLKHNRKELMRRDTMWDIPEGKNSSELLGRKVPRPPLRLD